MQHPITRRRFLMVSATAVGVSIPLGCDNDEVEIDREKIEAAAYVGVLIGERLRRFPHPAARIIGTTLVLAGELTIVYLTYTDERHETSIELSDDEVTELRRERAIKLQRQDGEVETYPISKVRYEDGQEYPA